MFDVRLPTYRPAPRTFMVHLRPLVDSILQTLAAMSPGQLREVGG